MIKSTGLKLTKQRKLVIDIINELGDNATIVNILNKCINNVDKSTVYRIIELFNDKGLLSKELNYNNEVYYRLTEDHGHYFTCIKCHKREKLDECPIESIENNLENSGYTILNHTVEINGICKKCK